MTRPIGRAAVAVAALLLVGCAQNSPGAAAEIGSDRITDEQVDDLAEALCVLSADAGQGPATTQQVRRQALEVLLDIELSGGIIDTEAVDREQVAQALQQAAVSREALPERLREPFEEAVEGFATAQLGLAALGRASLTDKGTPDVDDEAAFAEGQRLRARHAEDVGVSIDPRFGTWEDGRLQPTDGSLSVAVTEQARASTAAEAATAVTDLPANLTCSAG